MIIDIPYYEDKTRISNSAIGWFLKKGPAFLHKMLTDPPPEEKSAALERGTMIHEYILQPEEFQKDYVVWNESRPSSTQQEKFCQELAFSTEIEPDKAVLSAYKEAYSTVGKSDDKMLSEGLKIASTLKEYIDFLKANDKRIMISPWDYQMLKKVKQNVQEHKLAKELLIGPAIHTGNDGVTFEVYHEFHINWEYGDVKCKSLLDGLMLDFAGKKVTIFDLKTTQKLYNFEESIDQYDYLRQLMFYTMAVKWYLEYERKENPTEWSFDYYIIGIDTTGSYDIRVFYIDNDIVKTRMFTILYAIDAIRWHQQNNKWDHSRAYYEGDGSETLNL